MYEIGQGVEQNYSEAVKWYQKAAEQGDAEAQNSLGTMCRSGLGTEQDFNEAMNWFRKSAEQGNPEAERNIGGMYLSGLGVEKKQRKG